MKLECKRVGIGSPEPRWGHTSVSLINNAEFLIFGGNSNKSFNDIHVYNIYGNTWLKLEASGCAPSARYGHSATLFPSINSIVIYGGRATSKPFSDLHLLKLGSNANDSVSRMPITWKSLASSKSVEGRAGHTAVAYHNRLVVFGGHNNHRSKYYNSVQVYNLDTQEWRQQSCDGSAPSARATHCTFLVGNQMYIFGGFDGKKYYNDLYCLDLDCYYWRRIEVKGTIPKPRSGHSATLIRPDRMMIFGGCGSDSNFLNDVHILHMNGQEFRWESPSIASSHETPSPRFRHTANLLGNKVFIYAGTGSGTLLGDLIQVECQNDLLDQQQSSSTTSSPPIIINNNNLPIPLNQSSSSAFLLSASTSSLPPPPNFYCNNINSSNNSINNTNNLTLSTSTMGTASSMVSGINSSSESIIQSPLQQQQQIPTTTTTTTTTSPLSPTLHIQQTTSTTSTITTTSTTPSTTTTTTTSSIPQQQQQQTLIRTTPTTTTTTTMTSPTLSPPQINLPSSLIYDPSNITNNSFNTPAAVASSPSSSITTTTSTTSTTTTSSTNNNHHHHHNNNNKPKSPLYQTIEINNHSQNKQQQKKVINDELKLLRDYVCDSASSNNKDSIKKLEEQFNQKLKIEQKSKHALEEKLMKATSQVSLLTEQMKSIVQISSEKDEFIKLKKENIELKKKYNQLLSDDIDDLSMEMIEKLEEIHLKSLEKLRSKRIEKRIQNQIEFEKINEANKTTIQGLIKPEEFKSEVNKYKDLLEQKEKQYQNVILKLEQIHGSHLDKLSPEELISLEDIYHQGIRKLSTFKEQELRQQLAKLKKEKELLQDQNNCIICTSNPPNIVFIPCRHSSICSACSPKLKKCPICRSDIENTIERYT
eukprot:gene5846-7275_t